MKTGMASSSSRLPSVKTSTMAVSRRGFGLGLSALALSGLRLPACFAFQPQPEPNASRLQLSVRDYASMPMTGSVDGKENQSMLARVNFMREEPGPMGKKRFFVNDLNGPLYILDKAGGKFTTYLDFNGADGRPGLFPHLTTYRGYADGLISFAFDPDYARNGRFYTIHLEDPELPGSALPDNTHFPGVSVAGYELTPAVMTPGDKEREAVLLEWNPSGGDPLGSARRGEQRVFFDVADHRGSLPRARR